MERTASSRTVTTSSRLAAARPSAPPVRASEPTCLPCFLEARLPPPTAPRRLHPGTRPSCARTLQVANARTVADAISSMSFQPRHSVPLPRAFPPLCSSDQCHLQRSCSTRTFTRRHRTHSRRSVNLRQCHRSPLTRRPRLRLVRLRCRPYHTPRRSRSLRRRPRTPHHIPRRSHSLR